MCWQYTEVNREIGLGIQEREKSLKNIWINSEFKLFHLNSLWSVLLIMSFYRSIIFQMSSAQRNLKVFIFWKNQSYYCKRYGPWCFTPNFLFENFDYLAKTKVIFCHGDVINHDEQWCLKVKVIFDLYPIR